MSRANRKSQRIDITLSAKVINAVTQEPCVIRNFCQGGLFLEYDGMHAGGERWQPRRGEAVRVAFEIPVEGGVRPYLLPSRVAHLNSTGFGVSFTETELEVWYALMRMRKQALSNLNRERSSKKQGSKLQPELIKTLQRHTLDALAARIHDFLENFAITFDEAITLARNPRDQDDYSYARGLFESKGAHLMQLWRQEVEAQIATLLPERRRWKLFGGGKRDGHSFQLVEKERFEDWVMIAGLASKTEEKLGKCLFELEARLSSVAGRDIHRETNPLGPTSLLSAFEAVIEPYSLAPLPKKLLYQVLEREILRSLRPLYKTLNMCMVGAGVLLDDPGATPPPAPPTATEEAAKSPEKAGGKEREKEPEKEPERGGGGRWRKRGVLANLYRMFRPASATTDRSAAEAGEAGPEAVAEEGGASYDTQQVVDALNLSPGDSAQPLLERVEAQLARQRQTLGESAPKQLDAETKGVIGATAGLVQSLRNDQLLTTEVREQVQQLEVPLVKAALHDPEALATEGSAAANLLNDLERLSLALSSEDPDSDAAKQLKSTLQTVVNQLSEGKEASPESFARAQQLAAPLVQKYQKIFTASAQRLAQKEQGGERLTEAKRRVKQLLSARLGEESVPQVVVALIRLGWGALLLQLLLREGEENKTFQLLLGVVERLVQWLAPNAAFPPARAAALEGVLRAVEQGYASVPNNRAKQQRVVKALRLALTREVTAFEQLRSSRMAVASALELIFPEVALVAAANAAQQAVYQRWQEAIARLKVGDWLVQRREDGTTRPLSLVFVGGQQERFLLVDGKGNKALNCDAYALAEALERVQVLILEDGGLPLVQRAVQRVLKDTYEKMLASAESDSLTGLMNRRAFTKKLERALQRLLQEGGQDVLLVVDIDRFKVVNDLCGYEGGDRLLVNLTNILKTYLDPSAELARIGDDEFGILLPHCGRESGFEIAETQRRAIENYTFSWDGRRLPVSASLGLVVLDSHYQNSSSLLQDADAAAYLAKHAGRNVTRIYQSDDEAIKAKRGETEAVGLVEDAIQHGRLQLFLQRISPLFFDGEDANDRFEVLLRMIDGSGRMVEPREFIKAAEGYNRMRTLDRWVLEHFFNWVQQHHERLQGVAGFCLNLADQSLLDAGIVELIQSSLEGFPLPVERITFEVGESLFANHATVANRTIRTLQQLGCHFSLDNFGHGVASFSYLKDAPVSMVKIDGELIRTIAEEGNNYALVKSITEICHFMKKQVVAEQVESEGIIVRLRELDVDFIQGYAVGHPFPLSRLFEQI